MKEHPEEEQRGRLRIRPFYGHFESRTHHIIALPSMERISTDKAPRSLKKVCLAHLSSKHHQHKSPLRLQQVGLLDVYRGKILRMPSRLFLWIASMSLEVMDINHWSYRHQQQRFQTQIQTSRRLQTSGPRTKKLRELVV